MNTVTHLCRSAAVALLAGLLAWTGVVPALAATPKDLRITLPTKPVLVRPMAMSGKNLLVEAWGSYRLSHDNGMHWIDANIPFTCAPSCSKPDTLIGSVAGGVVATYTNLGSIDAYSLVSNARVGTSYPVPDGHKVLQLTGDLALLSNPDTGGATVRSLTTGAAREIARPSGYSLNSTNLLADGSVILRNTNNDAPTWIRISPSGDVSTVLAASSPTSLQRVSGKLLLFQVTAGKATSFCLITVPGTVSSCRAAVGTRPVLMAMSSAGFLVEDSRHALRWYPVAAGKIASSTSVSGVKLHTGDYITVRSVENAYPVIAQRNGSTAWLKRLTSGRKTVTVPLGWARRPVLGIDSLALTPTAILASGGSSPHTWWRSADRKLGREHRLNADGSAVTASGSRWTTDGEGLRLYDRTRRTAFIPGPYNDNVTTQSGPYLLASQFCSPPESDPDPWCPPDQILDHTGRALVPETSALDIFGTLGIEETNNKGNLKVRDFLDRKAPVVDITLPDPGPEGSYGDITIWGDWVAATKDSGRSSWRTVVHNYRTGVTITAPGESSLQTLGDGFAVIDAVRTNNLELWNFADGTITVLGPSWVQSATPVTTDGARVAFLKGGSLVIKTVAGAGKSAPRVLGVVAPTVLKGTWKAAIDVTKAIRSGRLEIRDNTGKLVRRLTTKASRDGSLRGISWNGRDQAGKRVAAGSYTYTLTNRAADGTGAIRLVDGTVGPIGTIQVP